MANKVYFGVAFEHFVESLEAEVVGLKFEVLEDGDLVVRGDVGNQVDVFRVAIDVELLFSDANCAEGWSIFRGRP